MKLTDNDLRAIGEIVAERYFKENGWKYVNLRRDISRIYRGYEDIVDQYNNYSYMSKDWYVENSADKRWHMCNRWQEIKDLVDFLQAYGEHFDFMVTTGKGKSLCIIAREEIDDRVKDAISNARSLGYGVYVFGVDVPAEIEFNVAQVTGGTRN